MNIIRNVLVALTLVFAAPAHAATITPTPYNADAFYENLKLLVMAANDISYTVPGYGSVEVYPRLSNWDGGISLVFHIEDGALDDEYWPTLSLWAEQRGEQVTLPIPAVVTVYALFGCSSTQGYEHVFDAYSTAGLKSTEPYRTPLISVAEIVEDTHCE